MSRRYNGEELACFESPSEPGGERAVMDRVCVAVRPLDLSERTLERIKSAVAEAAMNAMEHGNAYAPESPVLVEVSTLGANLRVRVSGEGPGPPEVGAARPDLEAKLDGGETPRGWGLFLMQRLADGVSVTAKDERHTVELRFHLDERDEKR